jgi:hypothetical protein
VDVSAWIALGSAIIALLAVAVAFVQARSAHQQADAAKDQAEAAKQQAALAQRQTELQERVHEDSQQPYVYVDIRPDPASMVLLDVVIENTGATVATNVRVEIDPPLASTISDIDPADWALTRGIVALPPRRPLRWMLDSALTRYDSNELPRRHRVRVSADGPFGPAPVLEYDLDLDDYLGTEARAKGTLHDLRHELQELRKLLKSRLPLKGL